MRHTYALMALLALASMPATLAQESFLKDEEEDSNNAAGSTGRLPVKLDDVEINKRVDTTESETSSGFNGQIDALNRDELDDMVLCLQEGQIDCQGTPLLTGEVRPVNEGASSGGSNSTGRLPVPDEDDQVDPSIGGFNGDIDALDLDEMSDEMILCLQEGRTDCEGTPMFTGGAERPTNAGGSTGRLPVNPTGINETIETMLLDNDAYLLCVQEGRTDCEGGIENGNRIAANPGNRIAANPGSDQSTGRLPVEDHDDGSGFNGDIDALDIDTIDYLLCVQEGRTDCDEIAPPTGSPDKPYSNRCADGSFGCFSDDESQKSDEDSGSIFEKNLFTRIFGGASDGLSTASLASACSLILIVQSTLF